MAKSLEKIQARELRKKGESIKEIAKRLRISKSSASIWCRDIELTSEQMQLLHERIKTKGSYEGRMRGARVQHERRMRQIAILCEEGATMINSLNKWEFLCVGVGIYLGEGSKTRKAGIANSDYRIIKFMMQWFEKVWKVSHDRFSCHILINEIHKNRVEDVERYWSEILRIPRTQFSKTVLIKAKNRKIYQNFSQHYGTLMLRIKRGTDLLHKISGLSNKVMEIE